MRSGRRVGDVMTAKSELSRHPSAIPALHARSRRFLHHLEENPLLSWVAVSVVVVLMGVVVSSWLTWVGVG